MNEVKIKELLEEFKNNKKVIEKLRDSYSINEILDVAFKEKMYEVILDLFKPIDIDGEPKMFFDLFSNVDVHEFIDRFEVTEEEKQNILNSIFNIDFDKIKTMKVCNTLPRCISGWGYPINSINAVIYYSEPACLDSMIYLFNNNIRTTTNDTDCVYGEKENGECSIRVDYDTLSDENKRIADNMISMNEASIGPYERTKTIDVSVPCNKNETIKTISDRLLNIVKEFKKQPILFGCYSKDQIVNKIREIIKEGIEMDNVFPDFMEKSEKFNIHYPDDIENFSDFCFMLVETGKVKEKQNGDLETEDGKKYDTNDFVDTIINSNDFISSFVFYQNLYYDPVEDKYWDSEELYNKYINDINNDVKIK